MRFNFERENWTWQRVSEVASGADERYVTNNSISRIKAQLVNESNFLLWCFFSVNMWLQNNHEWDWKWMKFPKRNYDNKLKGC
jgi:hypothetical protein